MNFAPYQDVSPETNRVFSPSTEGHHSYSPEPQNPLPKNPWAPVRHPENKHAPEEHHDGFIGRVDVESGRDGLNEFETSLPIRLDYEACLAYLFLPPVGGVLLLLIEQKSDYVRFHAWQSSLLFSAMIVLHLLFSWSGFLSRILFVSDIVLVGYLTFRAYYDANTLDRFEVPFFGSFASRILDDE